MRYLILIPIAALLGGCQTLKGLELPSPEDAGQFVAHEIGLATFKDVEDLQGQMREEVDALRAHSDSADSAIREDFAAADAAGAEAFGAAIAAGEDAAKAMAAAAAAKAAESGERAAAADAKAEESKKGVIENREAIDSAVISNAPEGPLTGVAGWGGMLLDVLLIFLGYKGVRAGGPMAGRRIAAAIAKAGAPKPPAA